MSEKEDSILDDQRQSLSEKEDAILDDQRQSLSEKEDSILDENLLSSSDLLAGANASSLSSDLIAGASAKSPKSSTISLETAQLPSSVSVIEENGRSFYLIGTAHVSAKSVEDVERTITLLKPDTVVIELCQSRYETLSKPEQWANMDIIQVIRSGRGGLLLASLLLSSYQRSIGEKLGVRPGAEMIKAMDLAKAQNCNVVYGDRLIQTTLRRAWRGLSIWSRLSLFQGMVGSLFGSPDISEDDLEKLKDKDVMTEMLRELGEQFPPLMQSLIHERDLYLKESIRSATGKSVVAVVGAGHVPGMIAHWKEEVDLESLKIVPKAFPWAKILSALLPLLILAGLLYAFITAREMGIEALKVWTLNNMGYAFIGGCLALAHPMTIVISALTAPISSLIPFIAAGWVAAFVEVLRKKPVVSDFYELQEHGLNWRQIYKNRVTHILLIWFMVNLGSAFGTVFGAYGVFKILSQLFGTLFGA